MTRSSILTINAVPLLLAAGLYGSILGRFLSPGIWFLWLHFVCFLMLCLFGVAMILSLLLAPHHARFFILAILVPCFGVLGSFPVTGFMLDKQDERFMRNLSRYEEAIAWIQHGEATPRDDRFRGLAPDIVVQKDPTGSLVVFFKSYPGPFGTRLRGYAYMSTDEWHENFVKVYGPPKKLTNFWYRI